MIPDCKITRVYKVELLLTEGMLNCLENALANHGTSTSEILYKMLKDGFRPQANEKVGG